MWCNLWHFSYSPIALILCNFFARIHFMAHDIFGWGVREANTVYLKELQGKLIDPTYLPTRAEVIDGIGFEGLSQFGIDHNRYEYWTIEYIQALSLHLAEQVERLKVTTGKGVVCLEVGAGNGALTHFLRTEIQQLEVEGVTLVATDQGSPSISPVLPVEELGYKEALGTYNPDIVLASWMPYGHDWTYAMRATPSVQEYILIGDANLSGRISMSRPSSRFFELNNIPVPPPSYEREGFTMRDLSQCSKIQLCFSDNQESQPRSRTLSFTRKKVI